MPITIPVLTDWQFFFSSLSFGAETSIEVVAVEGLDMPELRTSDSERSGDHGYFQGHDLLAGRTVEFAIEIAGDDAVDRELLVDSVKTAMVPVATESPLVFRVEGAEGRMIYCRPRRAAFSTDLAYSMNLVTARLQFFATDPRIYDETQSSGSTALATAPGGMTFPATFPISFGIVGTGGYIEAINSGFFPTRPVAIITGPVANPIIENQTAGKTLSFNITLPAGETLTVDLDAHSVLLNGTASRRSSLVAGSKWWELEPGTSIVRFQANTYDPAASLALSWRSARI